MSLSTIRKRLDKIQPASDYTLIMKFIEQGKYYDELTEDEQELYCSYHGKTRETIKEKFAFDKMLFDFMNEEGEMFRPRLEKKWQPPARPRPIEESVKALDEILKNLDEELCH